MQIEQFNLIFLTHLDHQSPSIADWHLISDDVEQLSVALSNNHILRARGYKVYIIASDSSVTPMGGGPYDNTAVS